MKKEKPPFKIVTVKVGVGKSHQKMDMQKAVSKDGHYIGTPEDAEILWKQVGITVFELRTPKSNVCTVGYNPKKKRWYGWSHRAMKGFKTRAMAARFAESVS